MRQHEPKNGMQAHDRLTEEGRCAYPIWHRTLSLLLVGVGRVRLQAVEEAARVTIRP